MRFFLIFFVFFYIPPTIISAQVFYPETEIFNSSLDGVWELPSLDEEYQIDSSVDYVESILLSLSINGDIEKNDDAYIFNKDGNFLVNNKLQVSFYSNSESIFSLSFFCETSETEAGFDDPFLIIFLDEKLIFKESDLTLCEKWQEKYFLFPKTEKTHHIYLLAGDNGDLLKNTLIKIKDLEVRVKPIIPTTAPPTKIKEEVAEESPKAVSSKVIDKYPSPPVFRNFNEPAKIGKVLGETNVKETPSDWKSYLPSYFPLLVGTFIFILSFYLLILLSDWFTKLKAERKK